MTITYTSPSGYTGILTDGDLTIYKGTAEMRHYPQTAIHNYFELREQMNNIEHLIDQATEQIRYEKEQEKMKIQDMEWEPIDNPPSDDRYILLSFDNFSIPVVGRYEEDNQGGGAYYAGDEDITLSSQNLFVNGWMELPKCKGEMRW